jgi:2-dehydro-3-deoxygluconokinase
MSTAPAPDATTSAGRLDVLAIGETLLQLTAPEGGSLERSAELLVSTAGAESNVASHLARLGHTAGMLTAVGDDPWGRRITLDLADAGVDVSRVAVIADAPTGVYTKGRADGRSRVWYHRAGSAASRLSPDDLARAEPMPRLIHTSGIVPALSPTCAALAQQLPGLRERGALLSFDVNHRPGLWDAATAAPVLAALARRADIVFVGRDEAERLWGLSDDTALRELLPEPTHLVIKDDDRDAVEWHGTDRTALAPAPVTVREVVGAGDAFAAGWLSAYLDAPTGTADQRLARGHAVAGLVLASLTDHPEDPAALARLRPARTS